MLPKKLFNGAVVSTRSWLAVKNGPDTMLSSIYFSRLKKNKHMRSHDELIYSHPKHALIRELLNVV